MTICAIIDHEDLYVEVSVADKPEFVGVKIGRGGSSCLGYGVATAFRNDEAADRRRERLWRQRLRGWRLHLKMCGDGENEIQSEHFN
nr:hypothetical protein Iba_chr04fCG12110 [Ipomoea batatas]